jgi:hypothetical protein
MERGEGERIYSKCWNAIPAQLPGKGDEGRKDADTRDTHGSSSVTPHSGTRNMQAAIPFSSPRISNDANHLLQLNSLDPYVCAHIDINPMLVKDDELGVMILNRPRQFGR